MSIELVTKCWEIHLSYPARSRWGTYRRCCFRRDGAGISVKTGSGKAAHTRNNSHANCTAVYYTYTVHNADTNDLY